MRGLRWIAVVLVIAFGIVRVPFEQSIASELKANRFREGEQLPDGPMREKLGQLGAAAALGGFRSFLATIYELRAITAHSEVDYDSVESNYQLTTQLQPREPGYWGVAGWMMDSNARRYYLEFDRSHSLEERAALVKRSVERGRQFFIDGLRYNPEDYALNRSLANHYAHRQGDFCSAAEAFARAASLAKGTNLAARHHAIFLAHCPGKEREAYTKLRAIAEQIPEGIMPGAYILHMRYLEGVLKISGADRFRSSYDLRKLYERLLPACRETVALYLNALDHGERLLEPYPKLSMIRMQRLEEILNIPIADRVPFNRLSIISKSPRIRAWESLRASVGGGK